MLNKLNITNTPWSYELEKQNIGGIADEGFNIFFNTVKDSFGNNICRLQDKSRAELISSAPDMLEALIDCLNFYEYELRADDPRQKSFLKAICSVEKATGKTWEVLKEIIC